MVEKEKEKTGVEEESVDAILPENENESSDETDKKEEGDEKKADETEGQTEGDEEKEEEESDEPKDAPETTKKKRVARNKVKLLFKNKDSVQRLLFNPVHKRQIDRYNGYLELIIKEYDVDFKLPDYEEILDKYSRKVYSLISNEDVVKYDKGEDSKIRSLIVGDVIKKMKNKGR